MACGGKAAPDASPALEDGTHFGFVTALDPEEFRLTFDEAELLTGREAREAAADDGTVTTPKGSYVRNPDRDTVELLLDEHLRVRLLRPCCDLHAVPFADWRAGFVPDQRTFYGTSDSHYELTIEDGRAVAIDEVYLP